MIFLEIMIGVTLFDNNWLETWKVWSLLWYYLEYPVLVGQFAPVEALLPEPDLHAGPLVLHRLTGLWQRVHCWPGALRSGLGPGPSRELRLEMQVKVEEEEISRRWGESKIPRPRPALTDWDCVLWLGGPWLYYSWLMLIEIIVCPHSNISPPPSSTSLARPGFLWLRVVSCERSILWPAESLRSLRHSEASPGSSTAANQPQHQHQHLNTFNILWVQTFLTFSSSSSSLTLLTDK